MFVYPVCTYYCTPLFEIFVFPIGTLKQRRQQMKQNTDCLGFWRDAKFTQVIDLRTGACG